MELNKKTLKKSRILRSLSIILLALAVVVIVKVSLTKVSITWFMAAPLFLMTTLALINWSYKIKFKALREAAKKYGITVLFVFISSLCFGQFDGMSAENMKALGISNKKEASCFITPISSNYSFFDSITFFESYRSTSYYGEKEMPFKNCTFLFEGDILITSLNDPQFKKFRSFGLIMKENDGIFESAKYQCKDNSGTEMIIRIISENKTGAKMIFFQYSQNTFFEFEVNYKPVPEKIFDVFDNIEELGAIYDQNFGEIVSDEETKAFLSQFGDPNVILNMMTIELFVMKHKHGRHR